MPVGSPKAGPNIGLGDREVKSKQEGSKGWLEKEEVKPLGRHSQED